MSSKLFLRQLTCIQNARVCLRGHRFAVHSPEPAEPHQLRDAAGIVPICLHRHRLEGVAHSAASPTIPRRANPRFLEPRIKP